MGWFAMDHRCECEDPVSVMGVTRPARMILVVCEACRGWVGDDAPVGVDEVFVVEDGDA